MATETKRQFVMLAQTRDDADNSSVCGWFLSEKLDGQRMYWDGGITTGLPVKEVPFANVERDDRFINQNIIATGLWSRNAKVIRAPSWFLQALPKIPLDGEVFAGRRQWELTSSIVRKNEPIDREWRLVKYKVFESPPFDSIFQPGIIETEVYTKDMTNILPWVLDRANKLGVLIEPPHRQFEFLYKWMKKLDIWNDVVQLLDQEALPYATAATLARVNMWMETIVGAGGEGLMLRKAESIWTPERTWNLVKVKKWYDAEAVVVGYTWGKKTKKGSRLIGMMGSLIVQWDDQEFEISGFSDGDRLIKFATGGLANDIGRLNEGKRVQDGLVNESFPIGTVVTFRYRDRSANGTPKSGNFLRKQNLAQ